MILVTGATGFVGSELICLLVKKNFTVVGLYRNEIQKEKTILLIKSRFKKNSKKLKKILWRKGNLKDFSSLKNAFKEITKVYHCAALISMAHKDQKRLYQINQEGTSHIVNLSLKNKIKKLLFVSSIAALGNDKYEDEINESSPWDNNSEKTPYSYSKYGAELEVWRGSEEGLNIVIINPGVILGNKSPIRSMFNLIKKGFKFFPSGSTGLVEIKDVINSMHQLMESNICNERFILVAENWSYKKIYEMVLKKESKTIKLYSLPKYLLYLVWIIEKILSFLGLKKRYLSKALIESLYETKKINGGKINSKTSFSYSPINSFN
ncbi:MAG: NAD-dependent epimerase/dehydratase family protein [Bacteroidota bacterium]|nr:NAD-dependent epimerase/dehydratase family protein [Bacteroidota bacterium]